MIDLKNRFIEALKKKSFKIRDCSLCGFWMPIFSDITGSVLIDTGCNCVNYSSVRPYCGIDNLLDEESGQLEKVKKFIEEVENE